MGAEQLSLLGREDAPRVLGFASVRRHQLDADSWLHYVPSFIAGHEQLFAQLRSEVRFKQERRVMYERELDVPRLYATLPDDGPRPRLLVEVERALQRYYAVEPGFERVGVALYRGGEDSVAWHRDHLPRDRPTLVAILSLGCPRRMLIKPFGGGPSRAFQLGWGDLFVMGGMCQADWQHCIPKHRQAQPRMSCVFRHVYG